MKEQNVTNIIAEIITEADPRAVDVLARTMWGEARGEGPRGMEAVASVVTNRQRRAQAGHDRWWGEDVVSICLKPWQFSCWNKMDPNRDPVTRVDMNDPIFRTARAIAEQAILGRLADRTGGATHYHVRGLMPGWAEGRTPCARIGNHVFYNDVE